MSDQIVALDVQYDGDSALAAGVLFDDWCAPDPVKSWVTEVSHVEPYEPGRFYRRELPCLLAVLDRVFEQLSGSLTSVIIDGHVWLDAEMTPGLGAHLYAALDNRVPVIGVAKSAFGRDPSALEVLRGESERPLFVTAAGCDPEGAADCVRRMHGAYRLPTLLKYVDALARGAR